MNLGAGDVNHCASATSGSIAPLLPGAHTVGATYTPTGNFAGSGNTLNRQVSCASTLASTSANVSITGGSVCISGATLTGNVNISGGASVAIVGSSLKNLTASGSGVLAVCGSTSGNVNISGARSFVVLGDPGDDGCGANTFNGTVYVQNNTGGVELVGNRISSHTYVNANSGTGPFPDDTRPEIEANTVGGNLGCTGNSPAPTNDSQPNTVSGNRSGQCGPGF